MTATPRLLLAALAALIVALGTPAFAQDGHDAAEDAARDVTTEAGAALDDAGHAPDAADDHGEAGTHVTPQEIFPTTLQGLIPSITALLSFVVVFVILYVKVWPKILGGLDERASKITEEIASAEAARKQAKSALEEYERNLAEARAEAKQMLEETRAKQGELAAQLKAKADADLGEMRAKAKAEIEAAKKAALAEIYAESVTLATTMAGKILKREVGQPDQQRLVEESLAEMQAGVELSRALPERRTERCR